MNEEQREELDESFRAIAIGYAMLDEAQDNPEFRKWLEQFLDLRLDEEMDRSLFDFLQPLSSAEIIPFPPAISHIRTPDDEAD